MSSVDTKEIWVKFSDSGLEENLKYLESEDCCYDEMKRTRLIAEVTHELKTRHAGVGLKE